MATGEQEMRSRYGLGPHVGASQPIRCLYIHTMVRDKLLAERPKYFRAEFGIGDVSFEELEAFCDDIWWSREAKTSGGSSKLVNRRGEERNLRVIVLKLKNI